MFFTAELSLQALLFFYFETGSQLLKMSFNLLRSLG